MTDRASAEGLREALEGTQSTLESAFRSELPKGLRSLFVATYAANRAVLRDTGPRSDSGIDAAFTFLRKRLVGTPPNVDSEDAWMASLLDEAESLARLSTPRTETSDR